MILLVKNNCISLIPHLLTKSGNLIRSLQTSRVLPEQESVGIISLAEPSTLSHESTMLEQMLHRIFFNIAR